MLKAVEITYKEWFGSESTGEMCFIDIITVNHVQAIIKTVWAYDILTVGYYVYLPAFFIPLKINAHPFSIEKLFLPISNPMF